MSIVNSGYKKIVKFYNSERREVRGYVHTAGYGSPKPQDIEYFNQVDFTDANVNIFNLDCTNHQSESEHGTVTLFTFSNGVKIQFDYYIRVSGTRVTLNGKRYLQGINDDICNISGSYDPAYTMYSDFYNGYEDQTIDHVTLYFYPPSFFWQGVTVGADAINYISLGSLIGRQYQRVYTSGSLTGKVNWELNEYFYTYQLKETPNISSTASYSDLISWIKNGGDGTPISPMLPSEDISGEGGGDSANPDYNPFSDPINFPDLPTGGSALASGFIKLYRPTSGELNQLAAKLWSDSFIEEIKKIQNDPLEAIISLHSVPFGIVGASRQSCRIGNYDSEITMDTIGAQFYTVDCGNISILEHWASALDYAPYTDIEIYLPFCGVKPLQIDDVMNRILNVKYNIDILTGAAICMVKCGDSVLYTYNTEIAQNIPISASNHAQLYQSIISAASAVVGVASGGVGAVVGAVQSAATVAASKHSQVSRGGSLGGSVGVLGDFVPYLIIHRPIQSLAAEFAHKKGYPSNITASLGSVSGYTEVDSIHLENIPCTDMEREELLRILQEGVIL